MTLLDDLRKDLNEEEGRRKSAYIDTRGYLTIGVGRCIDAKLNCGLSEIEIDYLLDNDIKHVISLCETQSWYKILDTDNRKRALLNLCFNLGLGRLLKFNTFLSLLQQKKWTEAAKDLEGTLWAKEVGPNRTARICQLISNG